ncbi:MAG: hypothetical protein L6R39_001092 [Caloplaca ligustica]|nr:MAG: hypothetical protein L6R39_001092 [Caloplaca ligustica]
MEEQTLSYWDMISNDFAVPNASLYDIPLEGVDMSDDIAQQPHEPNDTYPANQPGSASATPPNHQHHPGDTPAQLHQVEPSTHSESAISNKPSTGAASEDITASTSFNEEQFFRELAVFNAQTPWTEAKPVASQISDRSATMANPETRYPSPAATSDGRHSSPAVAAAPFPVTPAAHAAHAAPVAPVAYATRATRAVLIAHAALVAQAAPATAAAAAVPAAPVGPPSRSGQRGKNPSTARVPTATPLAATVPPPTTNQPGQNPARFKDPYLAFVHQHLTAVQGEFDDIALGLWIGPALRARTHYDDFITRILKTLDTFSSDPSRKSIPADTSWKILIKNYQASLATNQKMNQENEFLRREHRRLQVELNARTATSTFAQQPQNVELHRLQADPYGLMPQSRASQPTLNAQNRMMEPMHASFQYPLYRQCQQVPQPLSANQVISRYTAPLPQSPAMFSLPAAPVQTQPTANVITPPAPLPTQVLNAAILPHAPTQFQQYDAVNTVASPPIPQLTDPITIDLTTADNNDAIHAEVGASAVPPDNKRKYWWITPTAPPTAPARPTKMAKMVPTKAMTPATATKAVKKPPPRAPKPKVPRQPSSKKQNGETKAKKAAEAAKAKKTEEAQRAAEAAQAKQDEDDKELEAAILEAMNEDDDEEPVEEYEASQPVRRAVDEESEESEEE